MRSPFGFIVEPVGGKIYDNKSESGLVTSSSIENHKVTNRQAVVIAVPSLYEGPVMDSAIVVVHHNTFRKWNEWGGKERHSTNFFKDGQYVVGHDHMFMYKNDWADDWETLRDVIFVEPGEDEQYGKIKYSNEILRRDGIVEGLEIGFTPDSEYEFEIDGETLYKMHTRDICLTK